MLKVMLPIRNNAKNPQKNTETLARGYTSESYHGELSNEYRYDRVQMFFKNVCIRMLCTKGLILSVEEKVMINEMPKQVCTKITWLCI